MQQTFRRLAWRLGRRLYCWGRGDVTNDPAVNGECWLRANFIALSDGPLVLFDVGANRGDWSVQAIDEVRARGERALELHAFEPSTPTRRLLEDALSGIPETKVLDVALSSSNGEAAFFSNGVASGTNSLSAASGSDMETVQARTLDTYAQENGINRIGMMKVDTEGFGLEVLKGAIGFLSRGQIELVQFEYNWRWLLNRASLREVFALIEDKPYRFGKLVGERIEFHEAWHFELGRFFENNYVLVRRGSPVERLGADVRFDAHNVCVCVA
jgi:FkbM family methyltransferase